MDVVGELIAAGREIVTAGLVQGWGGNLSARAGEQIVITRSGTDLGRLTAADFARVDPGRPEATVNQKPSSELAMHLAAYRHAPGTQAVIHTHPPQALTLGLLGHSLPALTPDGYLHLGADVPLVPYTTPTTKALATAVSAHLPHSPVILLQNHGALIVAPSIGYGLVRLRLLEEQAASYLRALALGEPRRLTQADMDALDKVTGGRYRRP